MAASSSALAWPTADGAAASGVSGSAAGAGIGVIERGAGKDQGKGAFVVPTDGMQPRVDGDRGRSFACRVGHGNPDRRAGVRRAGGVGDARLDVKRIDAASLFERVQAVISHALEENAVGVEQPVEPVDHHAGRQKIEQRLVAPGFSARRRLGLGQPGRRFDCRLGSGQFDRWRCGGRRSLGRLRGFGRTVLALEPCRQLAGEFIEGAVFDRRQQRCARLAKGPERHNVRRRLSLRNFV